MPFLFFWELHLSVDQFVKWTFLLLFFFLFSFFFFSKKKVGADYGDFYTPR